MALPSKFSARWLTGVALVVALVLAASACTTVRRVQTGPVGSPSTGATPTPTASIFVPTSPIPRVPKSPEVGVLVPGDPAPSTVPRGSLGEDTSDTGVISEGASGVVPCGREEQETVSGVAMTTKWTCYDITGKTMGALIKQTKQKGPKVDGSRAVAATRWQLKWAFTLAQNPGGCDLTAPHANATITYIYPRVTNDEPASTIQAWETLMKEDVIPHEETHGKIATDGGKKIVSVLGKAKSAPTCDKLKKSADAAAKGVADDTTAKQDAFDEKESHR